MNDDLIINSYFNWMYSLVCKGKFADDIEYKKLFMHLHNTEFYWSIPNDKNRANDGIELRYRFATSSDMLVDLDYIIDILSGPCSVLEMMIALSLRCEETIMDDPSIGNRTSQWFWRMITNLGLGHMNDDVYSKKEVSYILKRFLDREYERDGRGGLFRIRNADDLRNVEIWTQLLWYLDTII